MVVVADHPRHLPSAVPEQPEVEESCHSVAIFRFAAVVDVKVVFTRQDRPVNCAVLFEREDLHGVSDGFAAQAEVTVPAQVFAQCLDQGAPSDGWASFVVIELDVGARRKLGHLFEYRSGCTHHRTMRLRGESLRTGCLAGFEQIT